jgi:hypothetical protein
MPAVRGLDPANDPLKTAPAEAPKAASEPYLMTLPVPPPVLQFSSPWAKADEATIDAAAITSIFFIVSFYFCSVN